MPFSNYLVESEVNCVNIYETKIENCSIKKQNKIKINSCSLDIWFVTISKFLKHQNLDSSSEISIVDQFDENEYIFTSQLDETSKKKLKITKKGFQSCCFLFSNFECAHMLVAVSYVYVSSIALPDLLSVSFVMILDYFHSLNEAKNWHLTKKFLQDFDDLQFINLCKDVSNKLNNEISGYHIYSSLSKYWKMFEILFKCRNAVNILTWPLAPKK